MITRVYQGILSCKNVYAKMELKEHPSISVQKPLQCPLFLIFLKRAALHGCKCITVLEDFQLNKNVIWKTQSKTSSCTRIVEAEQLQDDEPSKSTFFNSSSQLLRNVLICLCLIGQFRIELKRVELVHGFLQESKRVLPLMEPAKSATNN